MVTREQHEQVLVDYLTAIDFFENGGRDSIFRFKGTKNEKKIVDKLARRAGKSPGDFMRDTLVKHADEGMAKEGIDPATVAQPKPRDKTEEVAFMKVGRLLRESRIFEIPGPSFKALMVAANECAEANFVAATRAAMNPEAALLLRKQLNTKRDPATIPFEERYILDRALEKVEETFKEIPFPEHLPFEACFFATTEPIKFDSGAIPDATDLPGEVDLHGIIISRQLCAMVVSAHPGHQSEFIEYHYVILRHEHAGWNNVWTWRGPWHVDFLVRLVNEHQRIVVERDNRLLSERMFWKKMQKKYRLKKPVPPPFYIVNLTDEYIEANRRQLFPKRKVEWSHRWDVRGHKVARVRRGALPMPAKLERVLKKRNYRIFGGGPLLDVEVMEVLSKRRMPPKAVDEWLAVHLGWRNDFVKGPEGKPYVPSTHRVPERKDVP